MNWIESERKRGSARIGSSGGWMESEKEGIKDPEGRIAVIR